MRTVVAGLLGILTVDTARLPSTIRSGTEAIIMMLIRVYTICSQGIMMLRRVGL